MSRRATESPISKAGTYRYLPTLPRFGGAFSFADDLKLWMNTSLPIVDCHLGLELFHHEEDGDGSDGADGDRMRRAAQERHARASLVCPSKSVALKSRGGVEQPGGREHNEHDEQHAFASPMAHNTDSRFG